MKLSMLIWQHKVINKIFLYKNVKISSSFALTNNGTHFIYSLKLQFSSLFVLLDSSIIA